MRYHGMDGSPLRNVSFIPEKIVLGKYSYPSEEDYQSSITSTIAAFPSCRLSSGKWSQTSIFERLCDFKPNVQRDSEKELMKAIKNAVDEFDNTPQKGFKLIAWNENIYRFSGNDFTHTERIVLEDPRGFCIGIPIQEFFEILMSGDGNLKDGVLDAECVYAWDEWSFHIFPTSHKKYKKILAASRKVVQKEKDPTSYVRKSELQVGHVYQTSDKWRFASGEYMYLGIHDTFSPRAHRDAFENGHYDIEKMCKEESRGFYATDVSTSVGRMVFYRVGAKSCKPDSRYNDHETVFVSRGDISKCFVKEVPLRSAKMYNDSSKPVTLENVQAAMKTCLLFNKLDLTDRNSTRPMSFDLFDVMFGYYEQSSKIKPANPDYKPQAYPFDTPYGGPIFSATYNHGNRIKIRQYDANGNSSNHSGWWKWDIDDATRQSYYSHNTLAEFTETTRGAYAKIQPRVYDLKLENGTRVPPEIAVQLRLAGVEYW